jgi:hypothetical protein
MCELMDVNVTHELTSGNAVTDVIKIEAMMYNLVLLLRILREDPTVKIIYYEKDSGMVMLKREGNTLVEM